MKVTVLAAPTAKPEEAELWVGTVFLKNWTEFGALLSVMSENCPKLLIRNEHGVVSVEIQ